MTDGSQTCPIAKAAEIFCGRWTALILYALGTGATRFSELHRALPLTSRSLLVRRLRELEGEGIVARRRSASGRVWTYHLTPAGRAFLPVVDGLSSWGRRWSRRQLADEEIDIELLLWDIESTVRADAFDAERTVVLLEFTDQPPNKRRWWIVNEGGRAQLCLEDPGFEVDLHLSVALADMIDIWRGRISLTRAVETNRLEVLGSSRLRRLLPKWLSVRASDALPAQVRFGKGALQTR
jgi:DNA-binding HxlR family transcriptional regulator